MVSKPGHIKRLFPWQPLLPTAAQACFNQWQHLPIKSAGVCTSFLCICTGMDGATHPQRQGALLGNDGDYFFHGASVAGAKHATEGVQGSAVGTHTSATILTLASPSRKSQSKQLHSLLDLLPASLALGGLQSWSKTHELPVLPADIKPRRRYKRWERSRGRCCGRYHTMCQWGCMGVTRGGGEELNH